MKTLKNILLTIGGISLALFIVLLIIGVKVVSTVFLYILGGIVVVSLFILAIFYIGKLSGRNSNE